MSSAEDILNKLLEDLDSNIAQIEERTQKISRTKTPSIEQVANTIRMQISAAGKIKLYQKLTSNDKEGKAVPYLIRLANTELCWAYNLKEDYQVPLCRLYDMRKRKFPDGSIIFIE